MGKCIGLPNYNKLVIREIDASNPTAVVEVGSTDIINDGTTHLNVPIGVGPIRSDATRPIYIADGSALKKVIISATGAIGSISTIFTTLPAVADTRNDMEVSPDGTKLLMNCSGQLYVYDIVGSTYTAVGTFPANAVISGFEYVPYTGSDRVYFSYHRWTGTAALNGLDYVSLSAPTTNVDAVAGVSTPTKYGYGYTEIERGKDGKLYFAFHPNYATHNIVNGDIGPLQSIDPSTGTLSSVMISSTPVPVHNTINLWGYIIQKQIDGDDYSMLNSANAPPVFDINGISYVSGSAVPDIYFCADAPEELRLVATLDGTHYSYEIVVDLGTVSGSVGSYVFTPTATKSLVLNSTATYINENMNTLFLNGCGDSWLDGYRGPIQVSVNANDGCVSTNNTQIFNIIDPLDFLLTSPVDRAIANTGATGNHVCGSAALVHPITGGTLRSAITDIPQDRILINTIAGDCGPRFSTPSPTPSPTTAPPCTPGWLGATTAGIYQFQSPVNNNPYGLSLGSVISYTIVVEEFEPQLAAGGPLGSPTTNGASGTNKIVVHNTTADLSTGGIPANGNIFPATWGLNFNLKSYTGSYFTTNYNNIRDHYVYKVTYQANTSSLTCTSYKAVSYFKILDDGTSPVNLNGGVMWRTVNVGDDFRFNAYPNPTSDQVNFGWICKATGGSVEVIITDMLGHKVLQKDYEEIQGNNALSISVSAFAPGVYNYTVNAAGTLQRGTFVKN